MSEPTRVEMLTMHAEAEANLSKPERTPEEEAAHQLKKAEKNGKKREKRRKRRLSLMVITVAVFLAWLGSTVFVMFHEILASELGASHSRIKVALASYSVALIMIAIAGGRIADIIGRKRMFVIGGVGFSAAALFGLTVSSVESLVAVRAFMGFSAGLLLAATGGVLVSTMHGTTRHDAWLLWRGAGMAGMVLGPTVGPLIASAPNWRQLFVADALLMLIAVGIGSYSMKEKRDEQSVFTFAMLLPALLLGLGLLSPYLALIAAKEHWDSWTLSAGIVAAGIMCLFGFFALNRSSAYPLFDTDIVLHNRRLWITDLFGAIHVGALHIIVAAFTVILAANGELAPAEVGIVMLALTIPLITLHLLAHRLREQYGLNRPLETLIGCTLIVLSVGWWFATASRHPTYTMVLPSLFLMGSGFGMIRLFGHMGVIKATGKRWASTLFGTRTFSNHVGVAVGAILLGLILPATAAKALSNDDAMIAEQAAIVVSWAVTVVVICSAIFAAFKDEFLGHEEPHWHKPKAVSAEVITE
ncbi:MAG TPA: MFS transporter [Candidatus Binatia bacterium]